MVPCRRGPSEILLSFETVPRRLSRLNRREAGDGGTASSLLVTSALTAGLTGGALPLLLSSLRPTIDPDLRPKVGVPTADDDDMTEGIGDAATAEVGKEDGGGVETVPEAPEVPAVPARLRMSSWAIKEAREWAL